MKSRPTRQKLAPLAIGIFFVAISCQQLVRGQNEFREHEAVPQTAAALPIRAASDDAVPGLIPPPSSYRSSDGNNRRRQPTAVEMSKLERPRGISIGTIDAVTPSALAKMLETLGHPIDQRTGDPNSLRTVAESRSSIVSGWFVDFYFVGGTDTLLMTTDLWTMDDTTKLTTGQLLSMMELSSADGHFRYNSTDQHLSLTRVLRTKNMTLAMLREAIDAHARKLDYVLDDLGFIDIWQ